MGFLLYISQLACWQPCSSVYGCQDACLHLRAGSSCQVLEENTQQVVVDTCSKYFIYKAFVIWATTEELNWAIYSRTKLDQTKWPTVAVRSLQTFIMGTNIKVIWAKARIAWTSFNLFWIFSNRHRLKCIHAPSRCSGSLTQCFEISGLYSVWIFCVSWFHLRHVCLGQPSVTGSIKGSLSVKTSVSFRVCVIYAMTCPH